MLKKRGSDASARGEGDLGKALPGLESMPRLPCNVTTTPIEILRQKRVFFSFVTTHLAYMQEATL